MDVLIERGTELECVGGPLDGALIVLAPDRRTFRTASAEQLHRYDREDDDTGSRFWRYTGIAA